MRTAWFSPFPPVKTGIATCSAELVAVLRARGHLIDAYPQSAAHDFPWIQRQRPYDLIVYQFGNSSHHDYAWPYALRYPGLVVLHDTRLHHARAALLLREKRRDDYRRELAWCEPGLDPDAAELAVAGFDSRLYYEWPMVRALVHSSRLVAVHGDATCRELIERLSDGRYPMTDDRCDYADKIVSIRLGHGQFVSAAQVAEARRMIRARYGIPRDAIVFGVVGGLTPEKRIAQIVAAFRDTLRFVPNAHLLLAGAEAAHYPLAALISATEYTEHTDARRGDRITVTGYVADEALTDHIAAVDVSLNLRWPTARETSGPWLRALAAGKPTVTIDLLQSADVRSLDPRTWRTSDLGPRTSDLGPRTSAPVTVAIDIVDEDHSLRLAMRRLATDRDLRASLGRAGQEYWRRNHTIDAMADDYESAFARCASVGETGGAIPERMRPDGGETLGALLKPFGIERPL